MAKLTFDEVRVPLREVAEGDVRVGGTKVALEGIIAMYQQGHSPEMIQWEFDVVSLGDVYLVIGYYLHRKEEVDQYMQESRESWDAFVAELEAQPGAKEFYDRVRAVRRARENELQNADGAE